MANGISRAGVRVAVIHAAPGRIPTLLENSKIVSRRSKIGVTENIARLRPELDAEAF